MVKSPKRYTPSPRNPVLQSDVTIPLSSQTDFNTYRMSRTTNNTDEIVRVIDRECRDAESMVSERVTIGYIVSGEKVVYQGDRPIVIVAGEVYILAPQHHIVEKRVATSGLFEEIEFRLSAERIFQAIESLSINFGVRLQPERPRRYRQEAIVHCKADSSLRNLFDGVRTHLRTTSSLQSSVVRNIKICELIYLVLSGNNEALSGCLASFADETTVRFKSVIYKNIYGKCSISRLASSTNRSPTTFKRDFSKLFDESPHRWIVSRRLERANVLLTTTDKTISEIGADCGFESSSHFIKLFHERYGQTPNVYRHSDRPNISN